MHKVAIAISTFKTDESVISLCSQIIREDWGFEDILVVDSMGEGGIERAIKENAWTNVSYYNFPENIGAAGNLLQRLTKAMEKGYDYILALNHDAELTKETANALVNHIGDEKVGAIYPLKYTTGKQIYDVTGMTMPGSKRKVGLKERPKELRLPVVWSSSNGALYSLEPMKNGLLPNTDIWMCWEDLLYGLDLQKHGYKQFMATDAIFYDNYEYKKIKFFGKELTISEKPLWYFYYRSRNFALISFVYHRSFKTMIDCCKRTFLEFGAILIGWEQKHPFKAIWFLMVGFIHGITGKTGKWRVP